MATRDDDFFDFSEQIYGEPAKAVPEPESNPTPFKEPSGPLAAPQKLTYDTEVQTSYLLVNALLNLLVRKQIIFPHEVQALVTELHVDYIKKKKGLDTDGTK